MNEILANLFLGDLEDARRTDFLVDNNFGAIVSVCMYTELPVRTQSPDLEYLRIVIEDQSREPVCEYFEEAASFISKYTQQEVNVLVHCRSGISRSATVVLSFLLQFHRFSVHNAFFHVRHKRSIICPNLGFMEQLLELERSCLPSKYPSIDIVKYFDWYNQDLDERPAIPDLSPDD
eukprot:Filipodium_phascolosomae@DN611_c0_g1_i1.p1